MTTWIKLPTGFYNDQRVVSVGRDAKSLHVAAMCYAGGGLTDGLIPRNALLILAAQTGITNTKKPVGELIAAGLWEQTSDGFQIVGYLELNSSAEQVQAQRDAARERMGKRRSRDAGSQDVRANNQRTISEVRMPDTDTETKPEPEDGKGVAEGDVDRVAVHRGATRPAATPPAQIPAKPGSNTSSFLSGKNGKSPSPTVPPARATATLGPHPDDEEATW